MSKPRIMMLVIVAVAGLTAIAWAMGEVFRALFPDAGHRAAVVYALLGGLLALAWVRRQFQIRSVEEPDPFQEAEFATWDRPHA